MTSSFARRGAALVVLAGALAGCQSLQSSDSFLGIITPYKIEVVQGNVITSEQVAVAKPMSAWSASRTRKTSSALMWRWLVFWKTSNTLMRGSVALRPLFLSSSALVMGVRRARRAGSRR